MGPMVWVPLTVKGVPLLGVPEKFPYQNQRETKLRVPMDLEIPFLMLTCSAHDGSLTSNLDKEPTTGCQTKLQFY